MAKISGLGAQVQVADAVPTVRDISNDITDFTLATPVNLQDTTGLDKSAHERLALLRDMTISLKGIFNSAAGLSHIVFSTVTTSAVARSTAVAPTSNHSTPLLTCNVLYSTYNITRGADGALTWQADGSLADGTTPTWS
jgi:hypothetical protein